MDCRMFTQSMLDAIQRYSKVPGIPLNSCELPAAPQSCHACGSRPHEGIEYHPTRRSAKGDQKSHEMERFYAWMVVAAYRVSSTHRLLASAGGRTGGVLKY